MNRAFFLTVIILFHAYFSCHCMKKNSSSGKKNLFLMLPQDSIKEIFISDPSLDNNIKNIKTTSQTCKYMNKFFKDQERTIFRAFAIRKRQSIYELISDIHFNKFLNQKHNEKKEFVENLCNKYNKYKLNPTLVREYITKKVLEKIQNKEKEYELLYKMVVDLHFNDFLNAEYSEKKTFLIDLCNKYILDPIPACEHVMEGISKKMPKEDFFLCNVESFYTKNKLIDEPEVKDLKWGHIVSGAMLGGITYSFGGIFISLALEQGAQPEERSILSCLGTGMFFIGSILPFLANNLAKMKLYIGDQESQSWKSLNHYLKIGPDDLDAKTQNILIYRFYE